MSDVHVERLALEIPGLDAATARAVAAGVLEGLAGARIEGDFSTVAVQLDPAAAAKAAPGALAAKILAAILEQIG